MSIKGFNIKGNVEKIDYNSLENLPDISGGSTDEEWVELLNVTTEAETALVDIVAPEGKKIKKIHILINTEKKGLSTNAKIRVRGNDTNNFGGSNGETLATTYSNVGTWSYPTFIIESGALFPVALVTNGAVSGITSSAVYMSGVGQSMRYESSVYNRNFNPWKIIRIEPVSATFNEGVKVYAWGVYVDEDNS